MVVEIGLLAGSLGLGFGGAAGIAAAEIHEAFDRFVKSRKSKWDKENRPAHHPFACDFREALGLLSHINYTDKEVTKHARQASKWWHADRNQGEDHGFADFKNMLDVFMDCRARKRYRALVEEELETCQELGRQMDWHVFNLRFLKAENKKSRPMTGPFDSSCSAGDDVCDVLHVFLDSTGSMGPNLFSMQPAPFRIDKAKAVFQGLYPRFEMTPTNMHLIGEATGPRRSRQIVAHSEDLSKPGQEAKILDLWTTEAGNTYLWEYVYNQVKDWKSAKHEVIIITDGSDGCSSARFKGLHGFNELMTRMGGGAIVISLYLVGNSMKPNDAKSYEGLCMATGGFFHHDTMSEEADVAALQNFLVPLLLPDSEREQVSYSQQRTYQDMLANGEAEKFDWYLPLATPRNTFQPPMRRTSSCYSVTEVKLGAKVQLDGLDKAPHLNGGVGTCTKYDKDTARWQVDLESGKAVSVLAKNLRVLQGQAYSRHTCTEV